MLNPGREKRLTRVPQPLSIAVESRTIESADSIAVFQLDFRKISVVKLGPGSEVGPSPGIRSGRASTLSSFATATGIWKLWGRASHRTGTSGRSKVDRPLTGIHPDIQTMPYWLAEIDSSIIHPIISNPQLLPGAFEGRAILGGKE
ncbi:hypothetical protein STAS_15707 [Striga asiatica]|uniref:Uncharacterized protein n=1 Tax=Striga asiatica TaxID=4170 RepID=A0A5A7Q1V2_STRAF|nr:hypothetical protein STAS_15707 [Striga asiatica]